MKRSSYQKTAVSLLAVACTFGTSQVATFFTTSPAGGALPAGITEVGGIVTDFIGLNGTRVVSQLAASTLYVGFAGDPANT